MSQEHEQACAQIVQALTAAMNAASAHCQLTPPDLGFNCTARQYFAGLTEHILFFSGQLPLLHPSDDKGARTAALDLRTYGTSPSAIDVSVSYHDAVGEDLPSSGRDVFPLRNDFITPLGDVATSPLIHRFFHAVFGPQGLEVAISTFDNFLDPKP